MKHLLSHFLLFLCFVACENEPKSIFDFETTDEIVDFLRKDMCNKEIYRHITVKDITLIMYPSCYKLL